MSPRAHSRTNLSLIVVQDNIFSLTISVSFQGFYEDSESIGITKPLDSDFGLILLSMNPIAQSKIKPSIVLSKVNRFLQF